MHGICKSVWQGTSRVPATAWIILAILAGLIVADTLPSLPHLKPAIQGVAAIIALIWLVEVVRGLLQLTVGIGLGILGALLFLAASVIESIENLLRILPNSKPNPNSNPKA